MIEKKTVYISGPMSGLPYYNIDAFIDAEYALKAAGFVPFNPTWLVSAAQSGWEYKDLMVMDMAALSRCSYIYQLDGWENSKGACAEWEFAKSVGIKVVNKSWLDWYVKQIAEFGKRKEEEEDFMTKCLNKPVEESDFIPAKNLIKDPGKRCDTCEYYCGLYGIKGKDYCWEHRCYVMWNACCDKYILKGEKKDEEKEEINEDKMQEVGQIGGEVQDEEGRSS